VPVAPILWVAVGVIVIGGAVLGAAVVGGKARQLAVPTWLPSYWRGRRRRRALRACTRPVHVLFAVADHWEPMWNHVDGGAAQARVDHWVREYPLAAGRFRDADGLPPQHTWFFPLDQYDDGHVAGLAELVRGGWGEVEVHLHHDGDTAESLGATLREGCKRMAEHGLLGQQVGDDRLRYAFVHGNWSLCNSRPDGRLCGVDEELVVLRETGCYVDMTMPSTLAGTQTRQANSIYYADNAPGRAKSHDTGRDVSVGGPVEGDLMLIQGPLALNGSSRKAGLLPRVENAELSADNPPTPGRADLWIRQAVGVAGRPEWVFVKLHTHGCVESNWPVVLGEAFGCLHEDLGRRYNDGTDYCLHYVTARHMYNIARAAQAGHEGDPNDFRDFEIVRRMAVD
jgi:hypothetical protein